MLDSKNLSQTSIESLRAIPLDKEAKDSIAELRDTPFQTKVDIYDSKCGQCGFCRIECQVKNKIIVFNSIDEGLHFALLMDTSIVRTCEYPGNVLEIHGRDVYPTLTEIVSNGCRFWNPAKLEMDEEDEIYIEVEAELNEKS